MNNKGFVSTALIYTFFIVFLILMIFLLNSYSSTKFLTDTYRYDIEEELYELANADINLYIFKENSGEYEYIAGIEEVSAGQTYNSNLSYCKNKSTVNYIDGDIVIDAKGKDYCYVYFD